MTAEEVREWLGLPAGSKVKQVIVRGMADVKVPGTAEEQRAAFRAFLACAGKPYAAVLDAELTE